MKKTKVVLFVMAIVITVGGLLGYGIYSNFNYEILNPFLILLLSFVKFFEQFIATPNFTFPSIVYVIALGIAPILSLIFAISQLRRKRFIGFLLGFLSPLLFVYALVGLFIPYYPNILTNDVTTTGTFLDVYLGYISNNIPRAIIFGSAFGLIILGTFIIMISLLFSKNKGPKAAGKSIKAMKASQPLPAPSSSIQQQVLPTSTSSPTPQTSTFVPPVLPVQDQSLSELIKLVLQEEVVRLRSPFAGATPQVDSAYIHRIVREELSQFQMHFMSRAEAQLLVAQEVAALKAQLGIK